MDDAFATNTIKCNILFIFVSKLLFFSHAAILAAILCFSSVNLVTG